MPKRERLTWGGSLEAERQFKEACAKAAASKKAKPENRHKPKGEFKGTYRDYLRSPQWAKKRRKVKKHYGGKCTICGTKERLHVHHRHYRTLFRESMADLDLLCDGCHQNHHEGSVKGAMDPMTTEFVNLVS